MATERRAAIVTGAAGGREGQGAYRVARDRADADRADLTALLEWRSCLAIRHEGPGDDRSSRLVLIGNV